MTAFDNIKTNNWPAASNEFEDFLVLKLPLSDNASLTESLPVVAGSQELFPKRTLTNVGVSSLAAGPAGAGNTINIAASEYSTSGSVNNPGNLFDGDTSTTISSSDGSRIYWTPASNISVTKFEVYFSSQYSGYKIGVEVTGGSSQIITKSNPGNSPGWVEFTSIAGDTIGPSNQIMFRGYRSNDTDPGILGINAVRVNDKIVTTAAPVFPKKHYDNNAEFDGSTTNSPQYFDLGDTGFKLNNNPWTLETWFYSTSYDGTIFWSGSGWNNNQGAMLQMRSQDSGVAYYQGSGGAVANLIASNVSLNAWHHVALSANGSTVTLYIDGVSKGSATQNNSIGGFGDDFLIGAYRDTNYQPGPRNGLKGSLQDFRLYQGVAKYTSNFTPPGAILG